MRFRVEFVFLVISLIGYEDQCGLYLGKPMLFDDRVMDIPAIHAAVCAGVRSWWEGEPGWRVLGITESPITGPEGNREFLIAAEYD